MNTQDKRALTRCKHGKYRKRHRHRMRPSQMNRQEKNGSMINKENEEKIRSRARCRNGKKAWDNTVSNLDDYKLDEMKQVEKKLNRVSKHRHYAKELIKQQKRKYGMFIF